jgi:LacI family transcriptional regulator
MTVLHKFQVPMIVLGYAQHPYRLLCDNVLGGRMLMRHILDLGHRCIGLIAIPDDISPAADARLMGMRAEAEARGLDFAAFPRVDGTYSSESGAAAAAALLNEHPDLSVLVALNDRMAMGAIRQVRKLGYSVPDRISVIGYDDLPQSSEFTPALTTINQQLTRWGELAMNMLLRVMNGEDPEPVVLEPRLMVRKSTAPPAKAGNLLEQVI